MPHAGGGLGVFDLWKHDYPCRKVSASTDRLQKEKGASVLCNSYLLQSRKVIAEEHLKCWKSLF